MTDPDPPTTSAAHLQAVQSDLPEGAFAGLPEEDVQVFNFRFTADMVPGWTLARAREVETERGVRLIQVNARAEGSEKVARIEILETKDPEDGRVLFMETLARFQRNPSSILRAPPQIGEAEARIGESAFAFLRGNLVVTVTAIAPAALPVEELAEQLDRSIRAKPETDDAAHETPEPQSASAARPMIKLFTRRRARGDEARIRFAITPDGRARRVTADGDDRWDD